MENSVEKKAESILQEIASNWEDESSYNYIKKCDEMLIAWEFLRRNKNYITDYIEYVFRLLKKEDFTHSLLGNEDCLSSYVLYGYKENGSDRDSFVKWGIQNYHNPLIPKPKIWFGKVKNIELSNEILGLTENEPIRKIELKGQYAGIMVDFTKPLTNQFQMALDELMKWQKIYLKKK